MINKERALQTFMDMVQIDSVSLHEQGMVTFLVDYFAALGYEAYEDQKSKAAITGATAGNVIVKIPGTIDADPIMLCSHMDTVEPGNGIKPRFNEDGSKIVSDETTILGADDKAGIAQIIELVHVLKEQKLDHPPLELVFTVCEEIGLFGAQHLDMTTLEAKQVYVLDGGTHPGDAIIGGPSYYDVHGKIFGKAAHAGGSPDKGISAIQVAAHAISQMKLLKIDEETTTNVGYLVSDYPLNVVPEVAKFGIEVRSLDETKGEVQLQHILDCLQNAADHFGARLEVDVTKSMSAYQLADDHRVLKHFRNVCEANGIEVNAFSIRGGTDLSALMVYHGLEGIVIATGGERAHELQEALVVDDFLAALNRLILLVTTREEIA